MKNWYLIPLSVMIGMMVGAWGFHEDMEALKELKVERATKAELSRKSGFRAIADLAHIPDKAKRVRINAKNQENAKVEPVKQAGEKPGEAIVESDKGEKRHRRNWMARMSKDDLKARIDEAKELWRTRCELARTQWKAKLNVKGESSERFDKMLEAMNADLTDLMSDFTTEIEQSKELSAELGVKMMSAVTRMLAESYDALGECVEDDLRAEVANLPIHEFIDPSVFEPMIAVQDYLEPVEEK